MDVFFFVPLVCLILSRALHPTFIHLSNSRVPKKNSRAQHTNRKENFDLAPGTCVMYVRRGKVTRGAIGAPSKSGLWLGPARVIMTEAVQQWSGSVHSTTGQIGVVLVSHGSKLIRCHPTQLRRCSEREVSIASLKVLVQISMLTSVTELTNALSPGQYEDLPTNLPTRDDLRFGVDLEEPPVGQEIMTFFCSSVTLRSRCRSDTKHSHPIAIQMRPRF